MNATLTTPSRRDPSVQSEQRPEPVRKVGFVDRAALHLGIALIKWGRRPGAPARERRINRVELALLRRDRQYARESLANDALTADYVSRLAPLR